MELTLTIASLVSGFVQGIFGFGSAFVLMPLLLGEYSIITVTPLVTLLTVLINLTLFVYNRKSLDLTNMGRLLIGTLIGIPIGIVMLLYVADMYMKVFVGIVLIVFAFYSLFVKQITVTFTPAKTLLTGILAGIGLGAMNLNGPFLVVYVASQKLTKETSKSTFATYFLISGLVNLGMQGATGLITSQVLSLFASASIVLLVGVILGQKLFEYVQQDTYRKSVYIFCAISGIKLFASVYGL